ncbi:hypothetical protein ACU8KH_00361 [Lachancea thermotolerans]
MILDNGRQLDGKPSGTGPSSGSVGYLLSMLALLVLISNVQIYISRLL